MKHLDLFSGIGGFSLAADTIWHGKIEHTFVEIDPFCTAVLKKHWPEAEFHGDIDQFLADAKIRKQQQLAMERKPNKKINLFGETYLLTGGFPCQPFSHAGRRKGTADNRYKWPSMFDAITLFRPRWVIAENVAGLASWNDGVVLETVCSDLEKEGYEVQTFVIPACAIGAPHRRDRVWIVAYTEHGQARHSECRGNDKRAPAGITGSDKNASNPKRKGHERKINQTRSGTRSRGRTQSAEWSKDWFEVASKLCRMDARVSHWVDGRGKVKNSKNERLKALGNAIVPQVAMEIMRAIKSVDSLG